LRALSVFHGVPYWQDTVIFVVWDDWGGFSDHILPYRVHGEHRGLLMAEVGLQKGLSIWLRL